jgi:trk system potassium uptake protein TrkH
MFIGGCAGSTAGGLKVSRLILMIKTVRRDLKRLIHPRSVNTVKFEGKTVENETVESLGSYFMIYVVIFFAILIILSFEPLDFTSTFSAVTACFNNVGPGLGTVGPMGSYASLSIVSKWLLSVAMLLGRLEIFPILLTLSPSTWAKK